MDASIAFDSQTTTPSSSMIGTMPTGFKALKSGSEVERKLPRLAALEVLAPGQDARATDQTKFLRPASPRLFAVALNSPTHLIVSARHARLLRRSLGIVVHRFLRRTWAVAAEAMPAQKPNALTDHHQTKRQIPDSIELGRLSRRLGVEDI